MFIHRPPSCPPAKLGCAPLRTQLLSKQVLTSQPSCCFSLFLAQKAQPGEERGGAGRRRPLDLEQITAPHSHILRRVGTQARDSEWCRLPWRGGLRPLPGQTEPGPINPVSPPSLATRKRDEVVSCPKGSRAPTPRVTWMQRREHSRCCVDHVTDETSN